MIVEFKLKEVGWKKEDGSVSRVIAVATFNKGHSHIVPDDNCWVILNGGKPSA